MHLRPPPPIGLGCCPFVGGGSVDVDLVVNILPLQVGVPCLYLICYALLYVHSSFAIIYKRKRKLVALLYCKCFVNVPRGAMCWTALCDCGISDHTHLFFYSNV